MLTTQSFEELFCAQEKIFLRGLLYLMETSESNFQIKEGMSQFLRCKVLVKNHMIICTKQTNTF